MPCALRRASPALTRSLRRCDSIRATQAMIAAISSLMCGSLVSSYITAKARKGAASAIEGRGLVAVAPISAGELVAIKGGHIVTTAALQSLPERLQNSEIQMAAGFYLVALEEPSMSRSCV
jgi:hypothetical protein